MDSLIKNLAEALHAEVKLAEENHYTKPLGKSHGITRRHKDCTLDSCSQKTYFLERAAAQLQGPADRFGKDWDNTELDVAFRVYTYLGCDNESTLINRSKDPVVTTAAFVLNRTPHSFNMKLANLYEVGHPGHGLVGDLNRLRVRYPQLIS